MKLKCISQETLKLIACVTMLIDHIGAVLVPWKMLRVIGRLSFPIYCFLLVEGMNHTKDIKKYGLRLLIGALLSELPFDLLFYGEFTWARQSAMLTLFLGFLMILLARKYGLMIPFVVCYFAARFLNVNYQWYGIAMIAVFYVASGMSAQPLQQAAGLGLITWVGYCEGKEDWLRNPPIQSCCMLALIPIALYSGEKKTKSKWIQWGFYLFYPVHMLVLLLIARM